MNKKNIEYAAIIYGFVMIFCAIAQTLLTVFSEIISSGGSISTEISIHNIVYGKNIALIIFINIVSGLLSFAFYFSLIFKKKWALRFSNYFFVAIVCDIGIKLIFVLIVGISI